MKAQASRVFGNTKNQFRELLVSYGLRLFQYLLIWLPVKKNRIMVYVHERKGFTCNPKYVTQKLKELYGDQLEIIWATMYPDTCAEAEKMGFRVIKNNRPLQAWLYLRTRCFITNDAFPTWAVHRPGQIWINTWHGAMNYKHIGYDYLGPISPMARKLFKLGNRQPNYFLAGSRFFQEDTSASFRLDGKVFLPTGLPRNDIFFSDAKQFKTKIHETYHIAPDKKIILFAPTFRRGMKSDTYGLDFQRVCELLHQRFGGDWVMLFRNHNFVKEKQTFQGAIDVSAHHDMQELLCAADVLISDYSSCLYDFCLTKRPAFVYAPDLDTYRSQDRSFAYPIEKWPYPMARSNDELADSILQFREADFRKKVEAHLQDVGAYDNGTASEQVAKRIAHYCL